MRKIVSDRFMPMQVDMTEIISPSSALILPVNLFWCVPDRTSMWHKSQDFINDSSIRVVTYYDSQVPTVTLPPSNDLLRFIYSALPIKNTSQPATLSRCKYQRRVFVLRTLPRKNATLP